MLLPSLFSSLLLSPEFSLWKSPILFQLKVSFREISHVRDIISSLLTDQTIL